MWREAVGNYREVLATCERQCGVVSTAQLLAGGLSQPAIARRHRAGGLHRMHRGVYAVGHSHLTPRGHAWAAVLATGGVLSHLSAAWHLQLTQAPTRWQVTTLGGGRSTPAIRVHRSSTLDLERHVDHEDDGLPVTTLPRTLVDLAATVPLRRLEQLCHQAELLQLIDMRPIEELLATNPRGARKLRAALATEPPLTREEMERRFLALVLRARLPRPLVNAPVLGFTVDFLWPERRRIVETDSRRWHHNTRSFEQDRERDVLLELAGYRVTRFTWRQIVERPDLVAARLGRLLRG